MAGKTKLPIKRSGGVEVEADGNYNRLGWLPPLPDEEWWKDTNLGDQPTIYALSCITKWRTRFFNPAIQNFRVTALSTSDAIKAALGSEVHIDSSDHFAGIIDPASLHGAFGNEYHGRTPLARWIITKLDLLCAEAVGYKLRQGGRSDSSAVLTQPPAGCILWPAISSDPCSTKGDYAYTIGTSTRERFRRVCHSTGSPAKLAARRAAAAPGAFTGAAPGLYKKMRKVCCNSDALIMGRRPVSWRFRH